MFRVISIGILMLMSLNSFGGVTYNNFYKTLSVSISSPYCATETVVDALPLFFKVAYLHDMWGICNPTVWTCHNKFQVTDYVDGRQVYQGFAVPVGSTHFDKLVMINTWINPKHNTTATFKECYRVMFDGQGTHGTYVFISLSPSHLHP